MVRRITLSNGSRVVMERIPAVDTVSVGFWFGTGSANEQYHENGYTHFIEHMLFKGTSKYDAKSLIKQIEGVGGVFNAFTSRHSTAFYISVVSKYIDRAIDVLQDIVSNSVFSLEDIEREKRVIIEEIKMADDSPEELAGQQFFTHAYKGNPLSYPIAGTIKNIKNVDRDALYSYFKKKFHSNNLIISIAGNFDIENIEASLDKINIGSDKPTNWDSVPFFYKTKSTERNDLSQVYFALVCEAFAAGDIRNYTLNAVNDIFGGSSYSRLFQSVRETHGLCYNIYSYSSSFAMGGTFEIHGSTSLTRYKETMECIYNEIDLILKEQISEIEIEDAKEMYKGSMAFNKLNVEFIMNKNARHEYYYKRHVSFHEMYKMIDNITLESSNEVLEQILSKKRFFLTAVGPKSTKDLSIEISKNLKLN